MPEQHGFFKNRSIESNLICYSEYILNAMDNQIQVDAIYTDFRKAFDKIDHSLLVRRLAGVGVDGVLLTWMGSYLSGRTQYVSLQGYTSDVTNITSGVPQGSHLGPLMFLIYINNISECFKYCQYLAYADDFKIFLEVRNTFDCDKLQKDLNRFQTYCNENNLFVSSDKCHYITFTRNKKVFVGNYTLNGVGLKRCSEVRDLGVTYDSKLIFDTHINNVIKNSLKMLGYIMRQTKFISNPQAMLALYYPYVFSKLNFASSIWNPQYNTYVERLENVQKKFLKYLFFKIYTPTSVASICVDYKILSLENRRIMNDVLNLHKILNEKIDSPTILNRINVNVPSRSLRNYNLFDIPFKNTNSANNSPICRMTKNFNEYFHEYDIFNTSSTIFKNCIKRLLLNVNNFNLV